MPPPAVHDRFAQIIDTLSERLGTPRFVPHITLAGGAGPEADAVAHTESLAAKLAPVAVRLTEADYAEAYFRCLYVQAEHTPELLAAHRTAAERFGEPPEADFMPHLSLVYGDLPASAKEELLCQIGWEFETRFIANRVSLCLPVGPPDRWPLVASFALMGET